MFLNLNELFLIFFTSIRASRGSLVSFSLLRLLHCLLSKSSSVTVDAYTQIRALAAAKGLKLQTLFSQYKNPICQVFDTPTPPGGCSFKDIRSLRYVLIIKKLKRVG